MQESFRKIGRRPADPGSFSRVQGVCRGSPGAGARNCLGKPVTLLRSLSLLVVGWTAVPKLEAAEAEPEGEKVGAACLWDCGDGSVLGPPRRGASTGWAGIRSKDWVRAPSRWTAIGEMSQ